MFGIAINRNSDIGLAYNVCGSGLTYPSLRYTERRTLDPLGKMTEPETSLIARTSSNSTNRFGDYNCLVVDPRSSSSANTTSHPINKLEFKRLILNLPYPKSASMNLALL
jgi:hypothetical protein